MTINVTKRSGNLEPLNLEKIHKVLGWACEDITGVSVSEIGLKSQLKFYDGMPTSQIHEELIKTAADLISEDSPNYQYVAGNLLNYDLRKKAWGGSGIEPPRLYDFVTKMVNSGFYTKELLELYTEADYDKMDGFIDHDRDFEMSYIGLVEYITKYCVRDRSLANLTPLETPQFTYILAAALGKYDTKSIKEIKSLYNEFSLWNIGLPTPIMGGLRTPTKQFSSCTKISSDDTLESISLSSDAIMKYASKKAGIGIDATRIRAEGASVGKEKAIKHTGVMPFLRAFEGALKSCSQGGLRGASASTTLLFWHLEVMELLVLKNNKGTPDNRVRKLDYIFAINDYLYNRLIDGKDITLFSPSEFETPGLYEAYFSNPKQFAKLYEKYEKDPNIRKKTVSSRELFGLFITERKETGRIYVLNVDNVNKYSPFKKPITMSNLCVEINLPTVPMGTKKVEVIDVPVEDFYTWYDTTSKNHKILSIATERVDDTISATVTTDESQIALCTLANINLGNVKNFDDLEPTCRNAVRFLDSLLSYQDYMVVAAETHTKLYRPLGIGLTNLAYYLAKNNLKYSDAGAYELMHDTMEAISFYCIKASVELAKERGACDGYADTKWADGILPIDRYKKTIDEIVPHKLNLDWEWLREQLKKYGIRNATLLAIMPSESGSKLFNATNGIEPVRALITVKPNKDHNSKQVVPEFNRLKNKYDLLWDMENMDGIIKMMAVIQKFTCQGISTNLSYNPIHYIDGEIPMSVLLNDVLAANYYGLKSLYYNNLRDGAEDSNVEDSKVIERKTEQPVEELSDAESCDSCSI